MAKRIPPWTRDELILALDLYTTDPLWPPSKNSREIRALSQTLNKLGAMLGAGGDKYRNPNSVYMKLMNFRRLDSRFIAAGKAGLTRGGKTEEEVWGDFGDDRDRLRATADAIKAAIAAEKITANAATLDDDDEGVEAEEGSILTSVHRRRERSRKPVEQRKRKAMKEHDRLSPPAP